MLFRFCSHCNMDFPQSMVRCPRCNSELMDRDVTEGRCVLSVQLNATPDNFPESYWIVMFSTEHKGRGFCRSRNEIPMGKKIVLSEDQYGQTCS